MTDPVVPAEAPEPCPVCNVTWRLDSPRCWEHGPQERDCPFVALLHQSDVPAYNRVVRQVRRAEELEGGGVSLVPTAEYNSLRECMVAAADEVAALRAQVERLEAVKRAESLVLVDLHAAWDSDQDSKVGKLILALTGVPGIRVDLDAARATPEGGDN